MLGSFFTKYTIEKILDKGKPTFSYDCCINNKQRKSKCTRCAEICKEGAYLNQAKNANWEKCVNCNLCASACPSRALGSSYNNLEKYFKALEESGDKLWIACGEDEGANTLKVHCLASLPWEFILLSILRKDIVIDLEKCGNCVEEQQKTLLEENLTRVIEVVGEEYFNEHVLLKVNVGAPDEKEYSRRELMALAFRNTKESAVKLIPQFFEEENYTGLFYKILLHKEFTEKSEEIKARGLKHINWSIPKFTEKCWGCGICEKVCPQQGIKFSDEEKSIKSIKLRLFKCNKCGLCENICTHTGIDGRENIKIENLKIKIIRRIEVAKCTRCGRTLKNNSETLCAGCKQLTAV